MKILGLDLGTNSIGWALVEQDFENKTGKILGTGSRIIPMSQDILGNFEKGNSVSQTAERTRYRSVRRLRERHLLRRERLHRVLQVLGFLPQHYSAQIETDKRFGKFIQESEPKLAWKRVAGETTTNRSFEFLFKNSFEEMLAEFHQHQPNVLLGSDGSPKAVPYDWTIYYLRKKALSCKIEKEELAWILLNFNQKRGYYQLRGEEDETADKREYVISSRISRVEKGETDRKNNKRTWYTITLENEWTYSATFSSEPDWIDVEKEFLVVEELNENGEVKVVKDKKTDRLGKEKRRITPLPSFDEIDAMSKADQDKIYSKIKAKTELTIANSGKTVGTYIYENLLQNPRQKIRGKLVRTIERKFYKEELKLILQKQQEFHPELRDIDLYSACVRELYRNNEAHQMQLNSKDFVHLFVDDIIFYQRPLRSQKSSIGNCPLECKQYKDKNGIEQIQYLKTIPKSNPLYQEFRLWQWLYNLSIYRKDDDANVTSEFISSVADYEKLFDFLNSRKEIEQKAMLKFLLEQKGLKGRMLSSEAENYRWNYVEDKKYPCNETKTQIAARLARVADVDEQFLSSEKEYKLWHLIYSVTDRVEYQKALATFARKNDLEQSSFIDAFKSFPPFKNEYGAFSEKAMKKLLPLMRLGKYWNWNDIDPVAKGRIEKIITGEYDETIRNRVREKAMHLIQETSFQGLQLWLAQYIVYDRHSEAAIAGKWNSADDLEMYLKEFKQHSLRNPIVEQVVTETLRVVHDIWVKYGKGQNNYFDEIHIELGRDMKNTAEQRKEMTARITGSENTNMRIKALLAELLSEGVENVRPYSPMQQEILKVYEEGVLNSDIEIDEDILAISRTAQPSSTELKRYKLWLEQKYRSPYTGEMIPLSRLFTPEYEIEHIIPQSRYFDDSLSNKVICEAAVNKAKDNQLGYEFIKNHHGEKIMVGTKTVQVLSEEAYLDFIKRHYSKNAAKRNKLLLEEIPDKMIERQLNDTRYISRFISSLLSNIVRSETNDDGINSKNVVSATGTITGTLRHDWGLDDVWNELIFPRFERMNQLTGTTHFTTWNDKLQKFLPTVPLQNSKGFSKKRIDHRHHAMDALVIACATRDHINLLNNRHAKSRERFDLNRKLRRFEKAVYDDFKTGERIERNVPREFLKPWENFTADARQAMENIVVSFKQNLRVINKATNHTETWIKIGAERKKDFQKQAGVNWAIRKPLHKETVYGKVNLPHIKVPSGKLLTATRKSVNTTFNLKTIEAITDSGIQKILRNYLASKDNNPELAFTPEGIEYLNKNIEQFNDGKPHQPIFKARIFELGSKFPLGQTGNKRTKFVEAAKGTNLFFAIYEDAKGKRSFETIPLNVVIERQKQGLSPVAEVNDMGHKLLFHLSPNDLVYIPTEEELSAGLELDFCRLTPDQKKRLYNVNDFSYTCYFTPNRFAKAIAAKEADLSFDNRKGKTNGSFDAKTASFDGRQIKDICIKVHIDRLGDLKNSKALSLFDSSGETLPVPKQSPNIDTSAIK